MVFYSSAHIFLLGYLTYLRFGPSLHVLGHGMNDIILGSRIRHHLCLLWFCSVKHHHMVMLRIVHARVPVWCSDVFRNLSSSWYNYHPAWVVALSFLYRVCYCCNGMKRRTSCLAVALNLQIPSECSPPLQDHDTSGIMLVFAANLPTTLAWS